MARLSTGNTYGVTDRRTSQRLLGGTDATAVQGGELAQRQLQAPAIQPQAQLTNTFVQAGAPTLGGPVRMFEPPALPAPSRDMANLASALSSFNPALRQVGEAYYEEQQAKEKLAKERGEQLGSQLANFGFADFSEALREVEKKAAADPSLVPLLTELRANDPRSKRYAIEKLQELNLQQSMALAPEKIKNTSRLPDGRDRRLVPPSDPAFFDFMTSTVVPPGTSPAVLARNSTALMQVYGNIRNEQQKFAADGNDDLVRSGFGQGVTGRVQQLAGGAITSEQLVLALGDGLDQAYDNSRPSLYSQMAKDLPKTLVAAVQSIPDPETRLRLAGIIADQVLPNIPTGPRLPDGSRMRLIDTLEGETTVRDFFRDATKNVMEDRDLDQQVRGARAEDTAYARALQIFTPEVLNDPAKLSRAIESLPTEAAVLFPKDIVAQNAFIAVATKMATQRKDVYIEPLQQKTFDALLDQQAMNPTANLMALLPQYKALRDSGQLSSSQYSQLVNNVRTGAREDAQGAVRQAQQNAADYKKRLIEMNTGPGGFLGYEDQARINKLVAQFFQGQVNYIRSNPGKDVTQDLANGFEAAIGPWIEKEKQENRKPLNQTPGEVISRYNINTDRGKKEDNDRLQLHVQQKVLLPPDVTRQQLRGLLNGDPKALDPSTKRMLLRLKQLGVPASEYYTKQLQNMGDTVTPAMQQKLRELDGSDLLSSAAQPQDNRVAASTGRYSNMANNLLTTLQQGALNIIAPPAQARGSSPFSGSGSAAIPTGSRVAVSNVPPQTRALLRTIRFAEGTAGPDGYRTMFTGAKFDDLSRHPRRINRGGGLASDAAGAYQFLSTTWDSVGGGRMDPEQQDLAALRLIRGRGVDWKLPKGFTPDVADKLAPEWASFPTLRTGTSYYGQGGKSFAQLKAYYDRVLREEMARGR